jgi:hypothetical protein
MMRISATQVVAAIALACGGYAHAKSDMLGTVEMARDGTLTVKWNSEAYGYPSPELTIRSNQPAYRGYIDLVGGLKPGERKPMFGGIATVTMNSDHSLSIGWPGGNQGGLIVEPQTENVNPGSGRYEEILRKLGGLEPGDTKPLPAN